MAMTGDGRASLGEGEKSQITEEPQNSSGVPDQRVSISVGLSEIEQMMKQMTFTRSRICNDESDARGLSVTPLASQQQETSIENLPDDILPNIFIRLLAKQVAQMRCVSKSWNTLLSHPSFVKSHLHHSYHNNDQMLLVFYTQELYLDPKAFRTHPCLSQLIDFIKLPCRPQNYVRVLTDVIGSVHGLICSRYSDDCIQIWNPSISAVSTLPPYLCPRTRSYGSSFRFGFGFDPSADDYKVVRFSGVLGISFGYVEKGSLQVEVYSMRKGCWKLIAERIPSQLTRITKSNGVCVDGHNGHLHWFGHIAETRWPQTIVTFDLGSETFHQMNLPDSVLDIHHLISIGVLTGKLCVMSFTYGWNFGIEVWVMEEYGVAESWVKRHAFCPPNFVVPILTGFTSHSEYIYINDDRRIVLYDPVTGKTRILKNSWLRKSDACNIVEYVNTLIWVTPSGR